MFYCVARLYHKANEEAYAVYYTVIKHFGHLRTLEKCRKHSPAALVFYISLVFPNMPGLACLFVKQTIETCDLLLKGWFSLATES